MQTVGRVRTTRHRSALLRDRIAGVGERGPVGVRVLWRRHGCEVGGQGSSHGTLPLAQTRVSISKTSALGRGPASSLDFVERHDHRPRLAPMWRSVIGQCADPPPQPHRVARCDVGHMNIELDAELLVQAAM